MAILGFVPGAGVVPFPDGQAYQDAGARQPTPAEMATYRGSCAAGTPPPNIPLEAYRESARMKRISDVQTSGVSGIGDWGSPAEQEYQQRQGRELAAFQARADAAARERPHSVNTTISAENPMISFGNYQVPRDVYYGIHGPNNTPRYAAAKNYLEGVTGVTIGGGDRAAPGVTGSVTVDSQGRTIPNYGRNTRATYDYSGTQPMSLLAGSVQKMPFTPESIRTVQVKGEGGRLAIPTSRLADDNPWDTRILNQRASARAMTLTQTLVRDRPGFDPTAGRTMEEAAANVKKYEKLRREAAARGDWKSQAEYSRKEQAAAQNLNELSRAYHQAGKIMDVPIAANPFEAVGDLGVEFMKGTPLRDAERFSPISGELINVLPLSSMKVRGVSTPYGLGLQQDTWNAAMNRERGLPTVVNDFSPAASYIETAAKTGYMGPYGSLYGGRDWQGTKVDRPLGPSVGGQGLGVLVKPDYTKKPAQMVALSDGSMFPAPFKSVSRSAQDITKQPDLPRPGSGMTLPAPFLSSYAGRTTEPGVVAATRPSGLGTFQGVAVMGIGKPEKSGIPSDEKGLTPYERSILGGYSGGLIGYALWGEKSPEVIKGLIGASIYDATAGLIDLSRNKPAITQSEYDRKYAGYSANLTKYNAQVSMFNEKYAGELPQDTYARAQSEYGKLKTAETALLSEKATVDAAGNLLLSQKNEKWGEFSKWSTGAGEQISSFFGIKKDALEAYGKVLESSKAGSVADRIGYGFTKTIATDPGQVLSGAGAGGIWALGGAVIGGGARAIAAGGGRLAPAAARAIQFGNSPIGRAIPLTAFGGLTLYSASEGGTAGTSKTLMNLGGDVPGLTAMGAGNIALKRAFQSPRFGFKTESPRKPDIGENRLMEVYGTTEPRFVSDMIRQHSLKQNKPLNINEFTEPTMTVGERARILKGLSQAKNTPMNLDAARALLAKVPEPPMDIGKAALKYGPAGERPVYEPSTTIRTSKPIEAAPSWESTFRSPSVEPARGSRVIEPKMQLQPEPAAKTKTVLKYKEPVDVERLNRLLRPKELNIKTEAEYRKALPTYDELRKRGYDWNVALRMTPSAKPVTSPATGVYQEVKPHWSIPSALEVEAISERSFAQSKTRDYDTFRATLPKPAALVQQARSTEIFRAMAPKQATVTRTTAIPRQALETAAVPIPLPAIVSAPKPVGILSPKLPPIPPVPIPPIVLPGLSGGSSAYHTRMVRRKRWEELFRTGFRPITAQILSAYAGKKKSAPKAKPKKKTRRRKAR